MTIYLVRQANKDNVLIELVIAWIFAAKPLWFRERR